MSRSKKTTPFQSETSVSTRPEQATFTTKSGIRKAVRIIPRNERQEEYLEYLLDPKKMIVISHGPAGTGKSLLAMLAGIKALSEKKVDNLILCRPAIGVDEEDHGFLPGDINDKMEPWTRPLFDVLYEYYSGKDIQQMLDNRVIEMAPLMYMRGRNLKNCWLVLDEAQNCSLSQIKTTFTRICENTKIVVTGDNSQSDRRGTENGLLNFKRLVEEYSKIAKPEYIASVEFSHKDIERHPVVSEVLKIFGDY
jgi:phosphate starvation-inducible PhoH-like protein